MGMVEAGILRCYINMMGGNSGPLNPETVLRLSAWLAIYSHRFCFFFYLRELCCCASSHASTASFTSSLRFAATLLQIG